MCTYICLYAEQNGKYNIALYFVRIFLFFHSLSFSLYTNGFILQLSFCNLLICFFFELYARLVIYFNCCTQFQHINTPHFIYPFPC